MSPITCTRLIHCSQTGRFSGIIGPYFGWKCVRSWRHKQSRILHIVLTVRLLIYFAIKYPVTQSHPTQNKTGPSIRHPHHVRKMSALIRHQVIVSARSSEDTATSRLKVIHMQSSATRIAIAIGRRSIWPAARRSSTHKPHVKRR